MMLSLIYAKYLKLPFIKDINSGKLIYFIINKMSKEDFIIPNLRKGLIFGCQKSYNNKEF